MVLGGYQIKALGSKQLTRNLVAVGIILEYSYASYTGRTDIACMKRTVY